MSIMYFLSNFLILLLEMYKKTYVWCRFCDYLLYLITVLIIDLSVWSAGTAGPFTSQKNGNYNLDCKGRGCFIAAWPCQLLLLSLLEFLELRAQGKKPEMLSSEKFWLIEEKHPSSSVSFKYLHLKTRCWNGAVGEGMEVGESRGKCSLEVKSRHFIGCLAPPFQHLSLIAP